MKQDPYVMAQTRMKQAGAWWDVFDRAVHEYRATTMRYLQRRRLVMLVGDRARGMLDASTDWMLTLRDNIRTASRLASAYESSARVYWEEAEGLELFLASQSDRGDDGRQG